MGIEKCMGMRGEELVELMIPVFDCTGTVQLTEAMRTEYVAEANANLAASVLGLTSSLSRMRFIADNASSKLDEIDTMVAQLHVGSTEEQVRDAIVDIATVFGRKNPFRESVESEIDELSGIYQSYENLVYELNRRMKSVDQLMSDLDDYTSDGGTVTQDDYDELMARYSTATEEADESLRTVDYY